MLNHVNGRVLGAATALLLLVGTFVVFATGGDTRTLTAHFSRTVSIYKGSEVRVMGVRIGTVTSVVPEGDSVRVQMTYDSEYKLPADAHAAIVTPTLVADRFVQITPAYTRGTVMADGGNIPLARSATPVELDRIYRSLADLTTALGPNGANKNGSLDSLLSASAKALGGRGQLANRTLMNMAAATQTFGDNSGPLFSSVRQMSQLTSTLAANDQFVGQFMGNLAGVSAQLSGERGDLQRALAALARAVGIVRTFVHGNKSMVESDVRGLTTLVQTMAKEKDSLETVSRLGALGLGNLAIAFDVPSGSIGSRVQFGPTAQNLDGVLCDVVVNSHVSNAAHVCALLKQIVSPLKASFPDIGAGSTSGMPRLGNSAPAASLEGLLGGGGTS
jgi:phospholipid/cholesterol/gamma-HCH transport system substrate-binding protein